MQVPLSEIFHLEIFVVGNEEFLKISESVVHGKRRRHKAIGEVNAIRRPGIRKFVYFPPETLVQRKKSNIPRG